MFIASSYWMAQFQPIKLHAQSQSDRLTPVFDHFQEYTTMAQSIWMKQSPFWPELVKNIRMKNCLANLSN